MADVPVDPPVADAPAPAPASSPASPPQPAIITLTDYAEVDGSMLPKGKVVMTSQAEAQRLIAEDKARIATERDRRIGGFA